MVTVGGEISGYCAMGRLKPAMTPASVMMIARTLAKMGLSMKNRAQLHGARPRVHRRAGEVEVAVVRDDRAVIAHDLHARLALLAPNAGVVDFREGEADPDRIDLRDRGEEARIGARRDEASLGALG